MEQLSHSCWQQCQATLGTQAAVEDDRPLDTEEQGPGAQQAWQEAYYVLLLLTKTVKSSAREVGMQPHHQSRTACTAAGSPRSLPSCS